jgi:alkanesulfonate monooxygenase SsuD/methylene tetrahydromethanopterin reductase-like flavin-dependent oxidoreductase (luciferase family)
MKFELGAYSFGAAGKNPEGETVTTAQAVRNLLEQIRLAEQAGLDFLLLAINDRAPPMPRGQRAPWCTASRSWPWVPFRRRCAGWS